MALDLKARNKTLLLLLPGHQLQPQGQGLVAGPLLPLPLLLFLPLLTLVVPLRQQRPVGGPPLLTLLAQLPQGPPAGLLLLLLMLLPLAAAAAAAQWLAAAAAAAAVQWLAAAARWAPGGRQHPAHPADGHQGRVHPLLPLPLPLQPPAGSYGMAR